METIARPYARAVYSIAKDQDAISIWSDMLEALSNLVQVKELASAINNPVLQKDKKLQLLTDVLSSDDSASLNKVNQEQKNFLQLLIANGRVEFLPAISKMFTEMRQQEENLIEINITSAYELAAEESDKLAQQIASQVGKKASINLKVDPALVGGVIVEWDGKVKDASILGKLNKLVAAL